MNQFVVYHNPVKMEFDAREIEGFSIITKKPVSGVQGSRIWLITGRGTSKRYRIVLSFVAEAAGPSPDRRGMNEVSAAQGTKYRPELQLTDLPWFPA